MKFARLALAVLVIAAATACTSDITTPDPSSASFDGQGTYGPPGSKDCAIEPC